MNKCRCGFSPANHYLGANQWSCFECFLRLLGGGSPSNQDRRQLAIGAWAREAFGVEHATSLPQRAVRLLEESIELYQAAGADREMAHKLVDFIFARPVGEVEQEIGGVSLTLLAFAQAAGFSADSLAETELQRILTKPLEHWRARNAAKDAAGFRVIGEE